jgi:hypothetical protein
MNTHDEFEKLRSRYNHPSYGPDDLDFHDTVGARLQEMRDEIAEVYREADGKKGGWWTRYVAKRLMGRLNDLEDRMTATRDEMLGQILGRR